MWRVCRAKRVKEERVRLTRSLELLLARINPNFLWLGEESSKITLFSSVADGVKSWCLFPAATVRPPKLTRATKNG
jgi:hypothetical protein